MRIFLRITLIATLLGMTAHAFAGSILVADPHVRLLPPTARNTAAFMVLKNTGDQDLRLQRVSSPAANTVELHNVLRDGDVMKMRAVTDIEIKARSETVLKPGSYHVMLIGLHEPLKEGQHVALRLDFSDGSSQSLSVPVRNMNAAAPATAPSGNH